MMRNNDYIANSVGVAYQLSVNLIQTNQKEMFCFDGEVMTHLSSTHSPPLSLCLSVCLSVCFCFCYCVCVFLYVCLSVCIYECS